MMSPRFYNSSRVQKQVTEELGLKDLSDYDISVESTTTSRIIELGVSGYRSREGGGHRQRYGG